MVFEATNFKDIVSLNPLQEFLCKNFARLEEFIAFLKPKNVIEGWKECKHP